MILRSTLWVLLVCRERVLKQLRGGLFSSREFWRDNLINIIKHLFFSLYLELHLDPVLIQVISEFCAKVPIRIIKNERELE